MKKRILLIIIFLIIGLITIYIITIPKKNTWTYKLSNNYVIDKVSDTEIYLKNNKNTVIKDYISEFSYGDKFVLLKCVDTDISIKFYIIDTTNDSVYGPYLEYEVFDNIRNEVVDEEISEWIETINYKD